jgi:flavin-binding protein dodecin
LARDHIPVNPSFLSGSASSWARWQSGLGRNRRKRAMTEHVYKVVEIVGSSEESVTKAIERAVSKAGETLRNLGWFEVMQVRGHLENGKVAHYQVTLKVGFKLDA